MNRTSRAGIDIGFRISDTQGTFRPEVRDQSIMPTDTSSLLTQVEQAQESKRAQSPNPPPEVQRSRDL
jgi:hypothetical protein